MKNTKSKSYGILIASLMYVAASFLNSLCQAILLSISGAGSVQDFILSNSDGVAGYMVIAYILSAVFHVLGGWITVNILKRKYTGRGVLTAKYFSTISWTVFVLWSILGGLLSSRSGWAGAMFQSIAISLFSRKFIEAKATESGDISSVTEETSHREDASRGKEIPADRAPEVAPEETMPQKKESPKAMYCRKCGRKFVEESLYCPYCGEKSI